MRSAAAGLHRYLAGCSAALLGGCALDPEQSAIHPAGPAAAEIAWLWWLMFWAFTVVFVLVLALLGWALWRKPAGEATLQTATDGARPAPGPLPPLGKTGFIVAGGFLLPVVVVTPLFLLSLETSHRLQMPEGAETVQVVGHMWWWEVRYPNAAVVTANELHIPAGRPVRLLLSSADVIHSFWVPRLNGKRDLIPGIENEFWIQADQPGLYRGQCGEYCGVQHANMALDVIALPPDDYTAWLAKQGRATTDESRSEPDTPQRQRGYEVFMRVGCAQCHAVQGTPARGNAGPDLTHLGSRRKLASAIVPNTRGNLAGWISNPQAIKPGVKMPRTYLSPDNLLALVAYLEGLE